MVRSASLLKWEHERSAQLDRIEAAHAAVADAAKGQRWATNQIDQAYAMLLSSQFQGFCRDLHSEAADALLRPVTAVRLRLTLAREFSFSRKLDRGNPNPGNIGSDFARLGIPLWAAVHAHDARNSTRLKRLETLCAWRNAIAHQDFSEECDAEALMLSLVRSWRGACNGLARSFDCVVGRYLADLAGDEL